MAATESQAARTCVVFNVYEPCIHKTSLQREQGARRDALAPTLPHTPRGHFKRATLKVCAVSQRAHIFAPLLESALQTTGLQCRIHQRARWHAVRGLERGLRGAFAHFFALAKGFIYR